VGDEMMKQVRNRLSSLCSALLFLAGPAIGADQGAQISQRLQQELGASNNLRAFAMSAMHRPNEGGVFYALYVANVCGRNFPAITKAGNAAIAKEIASKGTISSSHLGMMTDLPQRCSEFIPGEAAQLHSDLKMRAESSGDPLVAARQALIAASKSGRAELLRAAVARLMELDDPLLWTDRRLYDYVAQFDPEARRVSGIFLNGKVYRSADGHRHLEVSTALELGFCKRDLPCAPDDELRVVCAVGGDCARDRYEKAKQYLPANGGTEDGWKATMTLVNQIQAALAAGNVSFFVR
jgi:hypothetical protein